MGNNQIISHRQRHHVNSHTHKKQTNESINSGNIKLYEKTSNIYFYLFSICFFLMKRIALTFQTIWSAGCFGLNGPLRQYFSLYRAVSQREVERRLAGWLVDLGLTALWEVLQSISGHLPERGRKKKMIDERKNVQTTPSRTFCSALGPCPTLIQISRTPRHWKFTQHHRNTRTSPLQTIYSRTSVARTLMARLSRLFRTHSWVPNKKSHNWRHYCTHVFWIILGDFSLILIMVYGCSH